MYEPYNNDLPAAWHEGYDSFETGCSNPYKRGCDGHSDFEWGLACAWSDAESSQ